MCFNPFSLRARLWLANWNWPIPHRRASKAQSAEGRAPIFFFACSARLQSRVQLFPSCSLDPPGMSLALKVRGAGPK